MGPGWEDGGGLYTFFPTEHDEEGGQQGDEGGQDGLAGKQRGEQAAEHRPGDEGTNQSIVDPDLLQCGPLPVGRTSGTDAPSRCADSQYTSW